MPFFFCAFEFGSFQRPWESRKGHGSAGLRVSLPSIFLGVVSQSNHSRTLSASNRFMAQTALEPHLMLVPYDLISTKVE